MQQTLSSVQSIFPEPGPNGLSAQLSTFWSSWDAIATNPSETAPRTEVIDQAQNIASTLNQATTQLTQTSADTVTQIGSTVTQVNSLLGQVAALNQSIVSTVAAGGQPNSLVDQRNNLVSQLGQDIGITTVPPSNGSINVYVGGAQLVQGSTADSLTMQTTGSPPTISIVSNNTGSAVPVSSGTMAGLLTAVNVNIPGLPVAAEHGGHRPGQHCQRRAGPGLRRLGQHRRGRGHRRGPEQQRRPLRHRQRLGGGGHHLGEPGRGHGTRRLWPRPPRPPTGPTTGRTHQALAELGTSSTGPDQAYQTFVTNLGSQVQTVTNQTNAQQSLSQSLSASLQSVTGVNTDQQTVEMLGYQQAYQASAKVISTIDTMVQSLLQAVCETHAMAQWMQRAGWCRASGPNESSTLGVLVRADGTGGVTR